MRVCVWCGGGGGAGVGEWGDYLVLTVPLCFAIVCSYLLSFWCFMVEGFPG